MVSDDKPPFKLVHFAHGLCRLLGKRTIDRLMPFAAGQAWAKERAHSRFGDDCDNPKLYRVQSTESLHVTLAKKHIREYASIGKFSAGARSEFGRRFRETLLNIDKICHQLDVSFFDQPLGRLAGKGAIQRVYEVMRTVPHPGPGSRLGTRPAK